MTQALTERSIGGAVEQVVIGGDLSQLSPEDRVRYYRAVCESVGLNPLTRPFQYLVLNDKLTLYASRDCTDQLRRRDGVNLTIVSRELTDGVYVVTARATTPDGREDTAIGAVALVKEDGEWKTSQNGKRYFAGSGSYKPLAPDDRANAMMKAETKAKRRVTLSICGLGLLDEAEIGAIADAHPVTVDMETGELAGATSPDPPLLPDPPKIGGKPKGVLPEALNLLEGCETLDGLRRAWATVAAQQWTPSEATALKAKRDEQAEYLRVLLDDATAREQREAAQAQASAGDPALLPF